MKIEYNRQKLLGTGGFGSVFGGTFNDRKVAVKRVELTKVKVNEELVLQQLKHPNVVELIHSENDKDFKFFVLELCVASLDQLFPKDGHPEYTGPKLPPHLSVFLQLAMGLEYIHSKNFVHRDIKPANVLLSVDSNSNEVTMKWADFGLSRPVNERGTYTMDSGIQGTANYFAPELLKRLEDNEEPGRGSVKSDVFAFGLVIGYLLLDGQHLYGSDTLEIRYNIKNKTPVNMTKKIDSLHYARQLLTKMLADIPDERIVASEVANEIKSIKIEARDLWQLCKETVFDLEKFNLLIKMGVNVNAKDNNGENALHHLCRYNSSDKLIDAINVLIQREIKVTEMDEHGCTALHYLCRYNSSKELFEPISLLIRHEIDVNGKDKYGKNSLHFLCLNNRSEKLIDEIRLLIHHGVVVNAKTNEGINALHFLCRYNSSHTLIDAIQLLIELGIDVHAKSNYGINALHYLCLSDGSEKLIEAINVLIKYGIDVNAKTINTGKSALHFLCQCNSSDKLIDAIKLLIQHGIDVKGKDKDGRNALNFLRENNSIENSTLNVAIKLLIEIGIDVDDDARSNSYTSNLYKIINVSNVFILSIIVVLISMLLLVLGKI